MPVNRHRRIALTLAETVVSMGIMSVLMVGMGSAILIASHGLPEYGTNATAIHSTTATLSQIGEELRTAIWISDRSASAMAFAVPDRDGDGVAERIRYEWSGAAGDALSRQFNHGTAVAYFPSVQSFDLTYVTDRRVESYAGAPVAQSSQQLANHASASDLSSFDVRNDKWYAQCFFPSLPSDVISWRVDNVEISMKAKGLPLGTTDVQLRKATGDLQPSATILASTSLLETLLPLENLLFGMQKISFSNVPELTPAEAVCLCLTTSNIDDSAQFQVHTQAGGDPQMAFSTSRDGGGTWDSDALLRMVFKAEGTITAPGPDRTATRDYVEHVTLGLQSSGAVSAGKTAITTLNQPEVLTDFWRLDFDGDPTAVDLDDDGVGDWARRDAQPFDTGSLGNGIWTSDSTLDTAPDNEFTELTTCTVRFRNTSVGGDGAVFGINVDWAGFDNAPIIATLQKQADGTQRLTLYHKLDASTRAALLTATNLPDALITLRLTIDPATDTVNMHVNETDYGTRVYNRFATMTNDRYASIYADTSAAQFDYVSVRVGGNNP